MSTKFMLLIMCFICVEAFAQTNNDSDNLNLDFERLDGEKPVGWVTYGSGDYLVGVDSAIVQDGKYAVTLEFDGTTSNFPLNSSVSPLTVISSPICRSMGVPDR